MIAIDNTIVSEDLLKRKFVCDLQSCKGACCVEGDSGAPLEDEECGILDDIFEDVKPYMNEAGIKAVEAQGKFVIDSDGDYVTPLVKGKECAYVIFDKAGIAKCAIEKAHSEGKIDFKKPVSCHLYPVRVTKYEGFDAVNYHEWEICSPACHCGDKLDVKVYKFLKAPLIRKYGKDWFEKLELAEKEKSI
ncbi:MAG: DUF3109 family protein [Bacteroidota bacterium]|nr:DUF3109 family protein [Bacteroidota bacterium]